MSITVTPLLICALAVAVLLALFFILPTMVMLYEYFEAVVCEVVSEFLE